jgi:hypothetical protein
MLLWNKKQNKKEKQLTILFVWDVIYSLFQEQSQ